MKRAFKSLSQRPAAVAPTRAPFLQRQSGSLLASRQHYALKTAAASYATSTRGREKIKFPWIWPSDSATMHEHTRPRSKSSGFGFVAKITKWLADAGAKNMARMAFGEGYLDEVREKMVQVVLCSTVDAINKGDYEALDQLMTPFLAKLYKHALANMRSQGYRLNIEVDDPHYPEMVDMVVKMGPPEAYDMAIPYGLRRRKYAYKISGAMDMAVEKMYREDGTRIESVEPPTPVLKDWIQFQCLFRIKVNVAVELTNKGKVVDSDQGTMEIPLALCTPFYEGLETMTRAFEKAEGSADLESFRWRVCDLLNIAERSELAQILAVNRQQSEN
ncbi:hypothetical protein GQ54DRAFT_261495 [Martensiomyces pterosporus]|nr:hypothetical protein GQ54DRAFT_261495 [Martensiomyces pterosporus]